MRNYSEELHEMFSRIIKMQEKAYISVHNLFNKKDSFSQQYLIVMSFKSEVCSEICIISRRQHIDSYWFITGVYEKLCKDNV